MHHHYEPLFSICQIGILTMCAQLIERTPMFCAFQIDKKKRTDDCRKVHNPDKSAQSRLAINRLNIKYGDLIIYNRSYAFYLQLLNDITLQE